MSTALHLRPRGASELVDATFALVRARGAPLLTLSGLCAIPPLARTLLLVAAAPPGTLEGPSLEGTREPFFRLFSGEYGWPVTLLALLLVACGVVLWVACGGAALLVAARAYLGDPAVGVAEALAQAWRRGATLLSALLQKGGLALLLALMCMVIAVKVVGALLPVAQSAGGVVSAALFGIAFMLGGVVLPTALLLVTCSMTAPAILLEHVTDGQRAIGRSMALTRGARWRLLGAFATLWVPYYLVLVALEWMVALLGGPTLAAMLVVVAKVTLLPLLMTLTTVLYFDLRIRREGLDLELLAAAPPPAPAPVAVPAPAGHPA